MRLLPRRIPFFGGSQKDTPLQSAERRLHQLPASYQQALATGGYTNPASGAGTSDDRRGAGYWRHSGDWSREQLDIIYNESWAIRKFIDIPVEDSLVRWRMFEENTSEMAMIEDEFDVSNRVGEAMRAARLYGGSILIMVTQDSAINEELDISMVAPGDLINLLVVAKPDLNIEQEWLDDDITSPTYGTPLMYRIINADDEGMDIDVHHSRVIRFDGQRSPSERYFGSSLVRSVLSSVNEESEVSSNIAYLIGEASILIYRPDRFREILAGNADPLEADPYDVLVNNIMNKSTFRTIVADKKDEVGRVEINFTGLPETYDRYVSRVAAAMDIPATRLWGKSPLGMNATGDSDWANYSLLVESIQTTTIGRAIQPLDEVLARSAGLSGGAPPYKWVSLVELSEQDRANISRVTNEEMRKNYEVNLISAQEWRDRLDGDLIAGALEGPPPEPMPMMEPMGQMGRPPNPMRDEGAIGGRNLPRRNQSPNDQ